MFSDKSSSVLCYRLHRYSEQ